jgi:2'-5' RNA ligase
MSRSVSPPAAQTIRLFYAIELSSEVRRQYDVVQQDLKNRLSGIKIRWSMPEDAHVTVLFLGDYPNGCLPKIYRAAAVAVEGMTPFRLRINGIGRFPVHGQPRVLWIGGEEPSEHPATDLSERLRANLPDVKLDPKPFRLHVTLGYIDDREPLAKVDTALHDLHNSDCGEMGVDRLVLMRSNTAGRIAVRSESGPTHVPYVDGRRYDPAPPVRKSRETRYTIVQTFPFQHTPRSSLD